ncbi:hypothetical protein B7494_g4255 [Chlorociboria aeruginascens]|nr:hypothetical protein B7494_g4255 [Chlorociboria aeruginascens]
MATKPPIVDIHTHIYPPSYISLLKSRSQIPYICAFPPSPSLRLVILPAEDTESTSRGRPIGAEYYAIEEKLAFMDKHSIDISVISLANPWLDWVPASEAREAARGINDEVDEVCAQFPGRLFAFATLPLSGGREVIVPEIERLQGLKFMRGVILGTTGLGKGLDDPELLPVFEALQAAKLPVFLHPHYGLPSSVWGDRANDYGHVLPLALGFPLETTIAVTRMILSGVFEKVPDLQMILAHSGGTLPFLAGRIESCIEHDGHLKAEGKLGHGRKTVWEILKKNIYLDAVVYSEVGLKAAIQASGEDRVMFGTDHPFFPPLGDEGGTWMSVQTNYEAIEGALGKGSEEAEGALDSVAILMLIVLWTATISSQSANKNSSMEDRALRGHEFPTPRYSPSTLKLKSKCTISAAVYVVKEDCTDVAWSGEGKSTPDLSLSLLKIEADTMAGSRCRVNAYTEAQRDNYQKIEECRKDIRSRDSTVYGRAIGSLIDLLDRFDLKSYHKASINSLLAMHGEADGLGVEEYAEDCIKLCNQVIKDEDLHEESNARQPFDDLISVRREEQERHINAPAQANKFDLEEQRRRNGSAWNDNSMSEDCEDEYADNDDSDDYEEGYTDDDDSNGNVRTSMPIAAGSRSSDPMALENRITGYQAPVYPEPFPSEQIDVEVEDMPVIRKFIKYLTQDRAGMNELLNQFAYTNGQMEEDDDDIRPPYVQVLAYHIKSERK